MYRDIGVKMEWCHNSCELIVSNIILEPKFDGICHESCVDDECNLEHSDFGS